MARRLGRKENANSGVPGVWVGVRDTSWAGATEPGSVPAGTEAPGAVGAGHRWHQAALAGTSVLREPGPGIPSPSRALSSAVEMPIPAHRLWGNGALLSHVGSWVVISDCTAVDQGAVTERRVTVCNPSETPLLTLERGVVNLLYPVFKFQCFAGNAVFQWNTVSFWCEWKSIKLGTGKSVSTLSWAPDELQRIPPSQIPPFPWI